MFWALLLVFPMYKFMLIILTTLGVVAVIIPMLQIMKQAQRD